MRTAITTCSPRIILCWCLLGLLWGSASCDNDKLHVRLNITEIPAAAQRLEVHALISGKRTSSHARVDLGAIAPANLRVGVMLSQELGLADFLSPRDSVRISVGAFGAEDRLLSTGDMFDPRPSIGSSLDGSVALRPVGQLASSKQGAAVLAAANPQEISGFSTVPGSRSVAVSGWGFDADTHVYLGNRRQCVTLQSFTQLAIPVPDVGPPYPGPVSVSLRTGDKNGDLLAESSAILRVAVEPSVARLGAEADLSSDRGSPVLAKALLAKGERLALVTGSGKLHVRQKRHDEKTCGTQKAGEPSCAFVFESDQDVVLQIKDLAIANDTTGVLLEWPTQESNALSVLLVTTAGSALFVESSDISGSRKWDQTWTEPKIQAGRAALFYNLMTHNVDLATAQKSGLWVYKNRGSKSLFPSRGDVALLPQETREVIAVRFEPNQAWDGLAALTKCDPWPEGLARCERLVVLVPDEKRAEYALKVHNQARPGDLASLAPTIAAFDADKDGDLDIIVNGLRTIWPYPFVEDRSGQLKTRLLSVNGVIPPHISGNRGIAARDLNGDGLVDLFLLDDYSGRLVSHAGIAALTPDHIEFAEHESLPKDDTRFKLQNFSYGAEYRVLGYGPNELGQQLLVIGTQILLFEPPTPITSPNCGPNWTEWKPDSLELTPMDMGSAG